jgi:hypothetical protein
LTLLLVFSSPNLPSPLVVVLVALGAEAWRCCQYTATLRIYQRNTLPLCSFSLPAPSAFMVSCSFMVLRLDGCLTMVLGLIKLLLGQKWSMDKARNEPFLARRCTHFTFARSSLPLGQLVCLVHTLGFGYFSPLQIHSLLLKGTR